MGVWKHASTINRLKDSQTYLLDDGLRTRRKRDGNSNTIGISCRQASKKGRGVRGVSRKQMRGGCSKEDRAGRGRVDLNLPILTHKPEIGCKEINSARLLERGEAIKSWEDTSLQRGEGSCSQKNISS